MAFWPFGRRKNRARKRTDAVGASHTVKSESSIANNNNNSHHHASTSTLKTHRRHSKRRKNRDAPADEDACILPPRQITTPSPILHPDLDSSPSGHSVTIRRSDPVDFPSSRALASTRFMAGFNMSQHSLVRSINDVPTLRNKRNSAEPALVRRKSSKRKRHDYHTREQEIKNMSVANHWDFPANMTHADIGTARTRPEHARSITPDSYTFKLSVFDTLSPRPVLRYAETPRYMPMEPPRLPTAKGKSRAVQPRNLDGRNRINELADQMDAGTLREMMDRDRRRRAARKSAEHGLKQENPKRSRQRPVVAPVVDEKSDPMDISQTPNPSASWLHDPSKDSFVAITNEESTSRNVSAPEEPVVSSDTKSPTNVPVTDAIIVDTFDTASQIAEHEIGSISDISRTHRSEKRLSSNAGRIGRSLSSIFRRGSRFGREPRRQVKEGPSFSVPSRESFARISHTEIPAIPKKSSLRFDGQSMRSRFTEHFDEPTSPEHIHSSSAIDIYPSSNRISVCTGRGTMTTAATHDPQEPFRPSGANSPDTRPNSMFLAQSLASIDSEGSWLSGKPSRRLSQARAHHRSNAESRERLDDPELEERTANEDFSGPLVGVPVPEEEEGADAEIIPKPHDDEETTWHRSIGKRAYLVSPGARAKSKEGLFTNFLESSSDIQTPDADSPLDVEGEMEVRRATSVDLGKGHARHISAGSAKLLDLPPRLSEERRPSAGTMSSGVLPSMSLSEEDQQEES